MNLKQNLNIQNLLWLALGLALVGSLKHLAAVFASVDQDHFLGWIQAVAIDVGLFSLSYSLRGRKEAHRAVWIVWLGIVLFTCISIYGNYTYAFMAAEAALPPWVSSAKPIVLAATLPILVLYLAELVADNKIYHEAEAAKEARKAAKKAANSEKSGFVAGDKDNLAIAREVRKNQMAERRDKVAQHRAAGLSNAEIAKLLEVSTDTVRRDVQAINENGHNQ